MSLKDLEARLVAMETRFASLLDKSITLAGAALEQSKVAAAEVAAIKAAPKVADTKPSIPIPVDVPVTPIVIGTEMVEVTNESLYPFTLPDGTPIGPARSTEVNDIPNRAVVPKWVVECASMKAMIDPPTNKHPRIFTVRPAPMAV